MPGYNSTPDEEAMYNGPVRPPQGDVPRGTREEEAELESTDEEIGQDQNSAVVDNKVLTGPDGTPPKEGDEFTVRVIKSFGNESEVACVPKSKPGADKGSMMSSAGEEIDAMDNKEMM